MINSIFLECLYIAVGVTIHLERSVNKTGLAPLSEYSDFLTSSLFYLSTEDELVGDSRRVSVFVIDSEGDPSVTVYAFIQFIHVCDHPPVPEQSTYTPQILEDANSGVLIQRVIFTDADLGSDNDVICQVSGNIDPLVNFYIEQPEALICDVIANSSDGYDPFDYERETSYTLIVVADGVECLQAETTIQLSVSN